MKRKTLYIFFEKNIIRIILEFINVFYYEHYFKLRFINNIFNKVINEIIYDKTLYFKNKNILFNYYNIKDKQNNHREFEFENKNFSIEFYYVMLDIMKTKNICENCLKKKSLLFFNHYKYLCKSCKFLIRKLSLKTLNI